MHRFLKAVANLRHRLNRGRSSLCRKSTRDELVTKVRSSYNSLRRRMR